MTNERRANLRATFEEARYDFLSAVRAIILELLDALDTAEERERALRKALTTALTATPCTCNCAECRRGERLKNNKLFAAGRGAMYTRRVPCGELPDARHPKRVWCSRCKALGLGKKGTPDGAQRCKQVESKRKRKRRTNQNDTQKDRYGDRRTRRSG